MCSIWASSDPARCSAGRVPRAALVLLASEKPAALKEVVDLEAAVSVTVAATVVAAVMTATQQARDAVRRDAAQHPLGKRAAQHTATRVPAACVAAARVPLAAAEQLA